MACVSALLYSGTAFCCRSEASAPAIFYSLGKAMLPVQIVFIFTVYRKGSVALHGIISLYFPKYNKSGLLHRRC